MFVDASAMIAILAEEEDARDFVAAMEQSGHVRPTTNVLAVWEAVVGLRRHRKTTIAEAWDSVQILLDEAGIEILPVSVEDLPLALEAFDRFGRHRYGDEQRNLGLNLADCFHYACASNRGVPILHKDRGLARTDIAGVEPGKA